MAVDTRNKRASLMSMGRPWVPRLPLPDGTLAALDRDQLIYRYAGELAAPALANYTARRLVGDNYVGRLA